MARAYPRPAIGMVQSRITETAEQARAAQSVVLAEMKKIDACYVNVTEYPDPRTTLMRQVQMVYPELNLQIIKAALAEVYSRMWCEEHNVGACMAVAPDAVTSNYLARVLLSGADEERDV